MSSPNGSKDDADWTTEETEDATSTHGDATTLSPSARTAQTIPSAVTAVTCSLPPTPRTAPSISTGSTARRISSGSTASPIPTSIHDWSVNGSTMDNCDESEKGSKMEKEKEKTDEAVEHELPAPVILQKGAVVTEPNESVPATSISAQKMSESSNESEQVTPTRYSSSVASSCPVILSSSPPVPSSPDSVERKEGESCGDGYGVVEHETPILEGTIVTEEETTAQLQRFDPAVVAEQKEAGNVEKGIEETHPPDEDIVKEDKKKAMRIKYLDFDDSYGGDAGLASGTGEEKTSGDQPMEEDDPAESDDDEMKTARNAEAEHIEDDVFEKRSKGAKKVIPCKNKMTDSGVRGSKAEETSKAFGKAPRDGRSGEEIVDLKEGRAELKRAQRSKAHDAVLEMDHSSVVRNSARGSASAPSTSVTKDEHEVSSLTYLGVSCPDCGQNFVRGNGAYVKCKCGTTRCIHKGCNEGCSHKLITDVPPPKRRKLHTVHDLSFEPPVIHRRSSDGSFGVQADFAPVQALNFDLDESLHANVEVDEEDPLANPSPNLSSVSERSARDPAPVMAMDLINDSFNDALDTVASMDASILSRRSSPTQTPVSQRSREDSPQSLDMNLEYDSSLNDGLEMNTSMGAPLSSRRSSPRESPVTQQSSQSLRQPAPRVTGGKDTKKVKKRGKRGGKSAIGEEFVEKLEEIKSGLSNELKNFKLSHMLQCESRGELLRPATSARITKIGEVMKHKKKKVHKWRILSSCWHVCLAADTKDHAEPARMLIIDGSARILSFKKNGLMPTEENTLIPATATIVSNMDFDILWKAAVPLIADKEEEEIKEKVGCGVLNAFLHYFASLAEEGDNSKYSALDRFYLIQGAIDELIPPKERDEVPDDKIEGVTTALASEGLINKRYKWALQLCFCKPLTIKVALDLLRAKGKFPVRGHFPVLLGKASRKNDRQASEHLQLVLDGVSDVDSVAELLHQLLGDSSFRTTRNGGLARTLPSSSIIVQECFTFEDIPSGCVIVIFEDELRQEDDINQWIKALGPTGAVAVFIVCVGESGIDQTKFINLINEVTNQNDSIGRWFKVIKVKEIFNLVACLSGDGLQFADEIGIRLEQILDAHVKGGAAILRPRGDPPKEQGCDAMPAVHTTSPAHK